MCSLVRMLLKTISWLYPKTFFSLLEKGCLYSFRLTAFFVNISTPSSFKDDETSTIFIQKFFLNCLVCLSSRAYWNGSQTLWRALFLNCQHFLGKWNKQMICCLIWNQKHCKRFFHSGKSQSKVHLTLCWWQQ